MRPREMALRLLLLVFAALTASRPVVAQSQGQQAAVADELPAAGATPEPREPVKPLPLALGVAAALAVVALLLGGDSKKKRRQQEEALDALLTEAAVQNYEEARDRVVADFKRWGALAEGPCVELEKLLRDGPTLEDIRNDEGYGTKWAQRIHDLVHPECPYCPFGSEIECEAGRFPAPDSTWRSSRDGKGFVELAAFDARAHEAWAEQPRSKVHAMVRQQFKFANLERAYDERATRFCVLRVLADRNRAEPSKIAEGPLSVDGAVAMAMLCPEPAWLRVLHYTCPMKYNSHTAGKSCEHCLVGELEKRLLRCARCKTVYFCDRACQKAAHPRHKLRCANLAQLAAKGKGNPALNLMFSDMDPLMASLVSAGLGVRSPESDAYLREAFGRGG